ncbi:MULTISPECIES: CoA transferase [Amycolatopsis]|uniref:2-methylfumaryl-CoA isomerase n=1 Tax=Amycolatopsis echigonensis TaxID=2576905 RepID=A0A2N3WNA2_9PSEU|nr:MULTISPECIES: CoA transferase [Amycolatopsis]PKV95345.1 2-methylfumaryl-CoA isomerase [Amycolatopsis niigatensis]
MTAPLAGLRVVEATSFVAGPLAGMTLAQLGATVLRIDPVEGSVDGGRWPLDRVGRSLFWAGLNKGVRSVALDLRIPEGQELATALVTAPGDDAGLFVDNTIGRLYFDHDRLRARREDLVHVHIQGYADGRAAMDYAVNPRYGVPMLTRHTDLDRPTNHVLPAWDIATGLLAVSGLLAGLRRRALDGQGSRIDLALDDVAAAHVAHLGWLAEAEENGRDRPRLGNHMYGAFGVDFACADGRRVIAVAITRQQWRDLVRVTGTEKVFAALETAHEVDLDEEGARFEHRALIEAVLAPWFAARTAAEVLDAAKSTRVMVGEFRTPSEVVAAYRRGEESAVLVDVAAEGRPPMLTATSPLRWDERYLETSGARPFGSDTHWALSEILGLSDREIGSLADRKIAGSRSVPGRR